MQGNRSASVPRAPTLLRSASPLQLTSLIPAHRYSHPGLKNRQNLLKFGGFSGGLFSKIGTVHVKFDTVLKKNRYRPSKIRQKN
jgi:hypothetical protein